jgi:hypothetical protein
MSVTSEEWLSRFILQKSQFRHDGTLKADLFIPHPHADLSVTRHLHITEEDIWKLGEQVAKLRGKTLYGRGVNQAVCFENQDLSVKPAPIPGNKNHANVTLWPSEKSQQKIIALEIAKSSQFFRKEE